MYIGFTPARKDSEITLRMQSKTTAHKNSCCGKGAGIPILRMVHLSIIRSIIDYAAPVPSFVGKGRLTKLEVIHNEAMRVILGCPRNSMVDIMRTEIGLQSIEINMHIFVDKRGAFESLASRSPIYDKIFCDCKEIMHELVINHCSINFVRIPLTYWI